MAERELFADCSRCAALCCVAPAFAKSSDFAIDKPAGRPCPNLAGHLCSIHDRLTESGFKGCVVFDCFGAGQRLTRQAPDDALALLPVMRQLHELMWYLTEALALDEAKRLHPQLQDALEATDRLASGTAAEFRVLDLNAYRGKVNPLLQKASRLARGPGKDFGGKNLIGRRLGGDLRGASFRGALLIGADLRGADLRRADFTGADLRGADLRGADLRRVLFLTESQRRAAITDQT